MLLLYKNLTLKLIHNILRACLHCHIFYTLQLNGLQKCSSPLTMKILITAQC